MQPVILHSEPQPCSWDGVPLIAVSSRSRPGNKRACPQHTCGTVVNIQWYLLIIILFYFIFFLLIRASQCFFSCRLTWCSMGSQSSLLLLGTKMSLVKLPLMESCSTWTKRIRFTWSWRKVIWLVDGSILRFLAFWSFHCKVNFPVTFVRLWSRHCPCHMKIILSSWDWCFLIGFSWVNMDSLYGFWPHLNYTEVSQNFVCLNTICLDWD